MKKLILFFMMALWFSGCAWFETSHEMEKTAEQLVSEGSSAFAAGDYKDAVKAYTDLKDWYPFSKYAILAELKIADAHYELEAYDEAIFAYEEFENMHPKNEAVPYIIYRIGLCWFNRLDSIDRDHAPAKNSLTQFHRLIDQFPESEYAQKAEKHIKICVDSLSKHELYVANFYMKTEKYKAALKRYEYLIENYPDSEESKQALNKIPRCRELANKK
ncbi:outer membrane protein assembly factor BamD [Desulfobacula toluolica]|uniref:Putative DNA uptake lipoprotein n=1 Tax=Desulfobacula toluolica (strain DSM 7467 / Tol2) TaxID=651182 RepID=K0NF19_DESTT|nr:outer membrane protein assembly factor BamD [Desulfobacula toluolica]CCK78233.1 putative DNA uptake lipoprotein [Desulfobacula toluolica Tol2]